MLEAAFWGFVGGIALLVGAAIGLTVKTSTRTIALVMAFGAGVLICSLAFELTEEAFETGGLDAVAVGFGVGAVAFFVGDLILDRMGGADRKRSSGQQSEGSGMAIALGALLDGIPESVAIGISLVSGGTVAGAFVAAVFISNLPEGLSAAVGLKAGGRSTMWIYGMWVAVLLASTLAAGLGYAALGDAGPNLTAGIQAFAAGAILVMLADTMMPEAFEGGGNVVGLVTALGFSLSFALSAIQR